MAWDIRRQLRDLTDSAGRGLNRVRQRTFLEALTAAYSLMLQADNANTGDGPRERLQTFIDNTDTLRGFAAADVDRQLTAHQRQAEFEPASASRQWLEMVSRVRDQPDAARLLVRVAMAVVGGAGQLNSEQQQVVTTLCETLSLPVGDFLTTPAVAGTVARRDPPAQASSSETTQAGPAERVLRAGERVALDEFHSLPLPALYLRWHWRGGNPGVADPAAFLLDGQGQVKSDSDMIFYNQPRDPQGGIALLTGASPGFELHLQRLPTWVERLAFSLTVQQARDFDGLGELRVDLSTADKPLLSFPFQPGQNGETAVVVAELYRRGEGWRFAAAGQGYRGGLAAMCQQYGVKVAD